MLPKRRIITVAEYNHMWKVGILQKNEPIELVNGQILHVTSQGSAHDAAIDRITRCLYQELEEQAVIIVQDQVELSTVSQPKPDISLLALPLEKYDTHNPTSKEIYLIIEVADTSLAMDQTEKMAVYAAAEIPEYWIVNLPERQIEVYQEANGSSYKKVQVYHPGEEVPMFDWGISLPVEEMLPIQGGDTGTS